MMSRKRPADLLSRTVTVLLLERGQVSSFLEELEHARNRGVPVYAEIVGYGMSGDAYHITAPPEDGSGAMRVMQATLEDAGVEPQHIDYINAHGTSTRPNDRIETRAIKAVFGEHARKLLVSSTKSMTGHLWARPVG